ncbi:hypothetical protein cypCar_00012283, partial [Cyprinus carpio]
YMETQHSIMKFQVLFLLLLLACMYPSVAQGTYENCCLKYASVKKGIRNHIMSFRVQENDGGCNIPAVVLKLKNSKEICIDPRLAWVKQMILKKSEKNTGKM